LPQIKNWEILKYKLSLKLENYLTPITEQQTHTDASKQSVGKCVSRIAFVRLGDVLQRTQLNAKHCEGGINMKHQ